MLALMSLTISPLLSHIMNEMNSIKNEKGVWVVSMKL